MEFILSDNKILFWKNDEVVTLFLTDILIWRMVKLQIKKQGLLNCFCVEVKETISSQRYGAFYADNNDEVDWAHIPFAMFPPEFRAILLLYGVS